MAPVPMAPMVPQIATMSQSIIAPSVASIPTVASVAPIDPMIRGSYVAPGLNMSQQMMTSAQFGYGYGMGPTVGTVVGQMGAPGYGITAVTN